MPDILANAGGVTVFVLGVGPGWVRLLLDRGRKWTQRLEAKYEAFNAVLQTSLKYKVDMRTAAYIVAISRVATVTARMRGMYALRLLVPGSGQRLVTVLVSGSSS